MSNENEPMATTGVVAPSANVALRELSALVGREIANVTRPTIHRHPAGPGMNQPLGWTLWFAGGGHSLTVESHDLRRADRLNEVALTHLRRPPDTRRLTSDDGRRLVRLLHEVIEAKGAAATTRVAEQDTNTEENR